MLSLIANPEVMPPKQLDVLGLFVWKKEVVEEESVEKRPVGRPKKEKVEASEQEKVEKRPVGRPKQEIGMIEETRQDLDKLIVESGLCEYGKAIPKAGNDERPQKKGED